MAVVAVVLAAVAVVMLVIAVRMWRADRRQHSSRDSDLDFNDVSSMSTSSGESWRRLELPGMSLEVDDALPIRGDFASGSAQSLRWSIQWQPGATLPPNDALNSIFHSMANAMPGFSVGAQRDVTMAGHPAREGLINGVSEHVIVTFGTCDGRIVQMITEAGAVANARARDSLRCTPKAGSAPLGAPIVVDKRPGWRRANDEAPILLANQGDVLLSLTTISGADALSEEQIANTSRAMKIDLVGTPTRHGNYKVWLGSTAPNGQPHPAALITWPCKELGLTGAIYATAIGTGKLEDGIALAETGRCLAANEKLPDYLANSPKKP